MNSVQDTKTRTVDEPLGDYVRLKTFVNEVDYHDREIELAKLRRADAINGLLEAATWMGITVVSIPAFECRGAGTKFHIFRMYNERTGHSTTYAHDVRPHCDARCTEVGVTRRGVGQRHGKGVQFTPLGEHRLIAQTYGDRDMCLFVAVSR